MKKSRLMIIASLAVLAAGVVAAAALATGGAAGGSSAPMQHDHAAATAAQLAGKDKAADLRVTLDGLLGEHALLAIEATQSGYSGAKDFRALAKAVDANAVELSNAIGSVFGAAAGKQFLNGKFLWRDHIKFFVDYTVALAKKDKAGQMKAVGNLKGYIAKFSNFLATATGLPTAAVSKLITEHVMELKGQLDAYAAGNYRKSYALTREAYHHMIMTGDALAGAIVKKFPDRY